MEPVVGEAATRASAPSGADTIVATASPPGDGLRSVVRVSGRLAGRWLAALVPDGAGAGRGVHELPLAGFGFPGRGTAIWMPGPGSYTAEDTLELHLPGAPPLLEAALEAALAFGCRLAQPGEFTRRAFENGRLDLSRAEGVADLIAAETEAERRSAQALLTGGLEQRVERLRDRLEELSALCEAALDFDESDTGNVPRAELRALGEAAAVELEGAKAFVAARSPVRELAEVVLLGLPNAGKSTLFNWLGDARALISPAAGTTRDALVADVTLPRGRAVRLVDLPGLERTSGGLEREAAERAAGRVERADLALLCVDRSTVGPEPRAVEALAAHLRGPGEERAEPLWVWTKAELPQRARDEAPGELGLPPEAVVAISARADRGRAELLRRVEASLERLEAERTATGARAPLTARHGAALERAAAGLTHALEALAVEGLPLDLVAEHLREALAPLEEVTGRTQPEDLLDRIFSRFCLGK